MEINLNRTPHHKDYPLEHAKLEAGWVGKFFGTGNNASTNIAGIILIGIIVSIIIIWLSDHSFLIPYCEKAIPVITLTLGYLFGKNA